MSDFSALVQEKLDRMPLVFSYGPRRSSASPFSPAARRATSIKRPPRGYHCFVTGEADEPTKHAAKEAGIHFVAGGTTRRRR